MRIVFGSKRFQKIQCRLKVDCLVVVKKTLIWLKPFASYYGLLAPKKWAFFVSSLLEPFLMPKDSFDLNELQSGQRVHLNLEFMPKVPGKFNFSSITISNCMTSNHCKLRTCVVYKPFLPIFSYELLIWNFVLISKCVEKSNFTTLCNDRNRRLKDLPLTYPFLILRLLSSTFHFLPVKVSFLQWFHHELSWVSCSRWSPRPFRDIQLDQEVLEIVYSVS